MWRVLVYLAIVAALAAGAIWLADQPGRVAFIWDGVSYSVGLAVAAVLLVLLVFLFLLVEAIVRWILRAPEKMSEASVGRKRRKGLVALSRGMIAVGSGDEGAARRYAREAQKYLKADEPLVLLLRAQAAQMAGDRDEAERAFRAMADGEETRVLGLRGLHVEARQRGDREAATAYAAEAARIAPAASWANEAVLEGHCARGDWAAALDVVERRTALGLVDKATAKRHRAVLLTADALSRGERDEETALQKAKEALRLAPDLTPAAALAGRILAKRMELRKAAKILETAWKTTPHPELADAYTHLRIGDSTHDRLQRAEKLATLSTWSVEGRLALARAALDARDFAKARQTIEPLVGERPSVRVCLMMADIERAEHGPTVKVREWLARAVHAPRDKAWVADGIVSDRWSPISPASGRLDAFKWTQPPEVLGGVGTTVVDSVVGDLDSRPDDALAALEPPVYQSASLAPPAKSASAAVEDAQIVAPAAKPSVEPLASASEPEAAPAPNVERRVERPVEPPVEPAPEPTARPASRPVVEPAATARVEPEPVPAPAPEPVPPPAPRTEAPPTPKPFTPVRREEPARASAAVSGETAVPQPAPAPTPRPVAVLAKAPEPVTTPAVEPVVDPVPAAPADPAPVPPAQQPPTTAGSWLRRDQDTLQAALAASRRVEATPAPTPPAPPPEPVPDVEDVPDLGRRPPDDPGVVEEERKPRFRLFG